MASKKKTIAELEATIRPKVDTEENAYRWVEHLALVENITEEELTKMVSELNVSHYRDVIEERAISKVCGYPLCCVKLAKRPSQKYHISTKHNKVFDLSERGLFCSVYCFKASKYIESQIPEEPIWLRDNEMVVDVKLLPKREASRQKRIGEITICDPKVNIDDIEIKEENTGIDHDTLSEEEDSSTEFMNVNFNTTSTNKPSKYGKSNLKVSDNQISVHPKKVKFINSSDVKKAVSKQTTYCCATHLIGILKEWFTKESYEHLSSLSENSDSDDEESDPAAETCIPDPGKFQMNMMNFLSNNPEWVTESKISKAFRQLNIDDSNNSENEDNITKSHILPRIDLKSQKMARRKIVHEKIYVSLNDILPVCGLLDADLTQVGFFKLIDTFNFSSKNIVLNARQWLLMVIVLLEIISMYKNFGDIRLRDDEIDNFLIFRNILPNMQQLKEIVDNVINDMNTRYSHRIYKTNSGEGEHFNGMIVDGILCKYDDMEELD